jgi:hypothetical protein
MSGVDSIQQIVATIRAQVAADIGTRHPNVPLKNVNQRQSGKVDNSSSNQSQMGALIGKRVQALNKDDPKRRNKIFRIFLESIFIAEFGEALINDPEFYVMVDDIQKKMEHDPGLSDTINSAISMLLDTHSV